MAHLTALNSLWRAIHLTLQLVTKLSETSSLGDGFAIGQLVSLVVWAVADSKAW